MNKKYDDRNKLFFRFATPYVVLVVLLFIIVFLWSISRNNSNIRKDVEEHITVSTENAMSFIEMHLNEMDHIAYGLSNRSTLSTYYVFTNNYAHVSTQLEIQPYVNANALIDEIFIYYGDSIARRYGSTAKIVCSRGMRDAGTLWDREYSFIDINSDNLQQIAEEKKTSLLIGDVQNMAKYPMSEHSLMYIVPNGSDSLIIFCLNSAKLEAYFRNEIDYYEGCLIIRNSENEILLSVTSGENEFESYNDIDYDTDGITVFGDKNVIKAVNVNTHYHLSIEQNWAQTIFARLFQSSIQMEAPLMLVLLAGGLILAFLLSRVAFKPIGDVFTSVAGISEPLTVSFTGMVESMHEIESRLSQLEYQANMQRDLCTLQVVGNLIYGRYSEESDIIKTLLENNIELQNKFYSVCVIRIHLERGDNQKVLIRYIEQCARIDDEKRVAIALTENNNFACVSSFNTQIDLETYYVRLYTTLKKGLEENTDLSMGFGDITDRLTEVPSSFSSAMTALEYTFILGHESPVNIDAIREKSSNHIIWYPVREEDILIHAIESCNQQAAIESVDAMSHSLLSNYTSVRVVKSILSGVIHRIADVVQSKEIERMEAVLFQIEHSMNNTETTLDQVISEIRDAVVSICNANQIKQVPEITSRCTNVTQYLEKSLSNVELSMNSIAEAFNISPGYLARLYKQETGKTVVQVLEELRMHKAETMLRETNVSLNDICTECGYVDKSNFIRKFRKQYNTTPMRYREIYNNHSEKQ